MSGFLGQLWSKMGTAYRAEVGKRLASRGLLYEDLLVETADVKLAVRRGGKSTPENRPPARLKRRVLIVDRVLLSRVRAALAPAQGRAGGA